MRLAEARRQDAKNFESALCRAREQDAMMTYYRLRLIIMEVDQWHGTQTAHEYEMPVVPESVIAMQYGGRDVRLRSKSPLLFTNGYPADWPENPKPTDIVDHSGHCINGVIDKASH